MTFEEMLVALKRVRVPPPCRCVTSSYGRHCAKCDAYFTTGEWAQVLCPACFAELQAALRGPSDPDGYNAFREMTQQAVRTVTRQNLAKGIPHVWH